jgi:hypothetical protein
MDLRERLKAMVDGMPPGSSVSVPVDWLRECLAAEEREGDRPDRLLTLEDVAGEVGRAVSTVRTWCNSGKLEGAFRLNGKDWRIPSASLRRYLEAQANPEATAGTIDGNGHPKIGAWRKRRKGQAA